MKREQRETVSTPKANPDLEHANLCPPSLTAKKLGMLESVTTEVFVAPPPVWTRYLDSRLKHFNVR